MLKGICRTFCVFTLAATLFAALLYGAGNFQGFLASNQMLLLRITGAFGLAGLCAAGGGFVFQTAKAVYRRSPGLGVLGLLYVLSGALCLAFTLGAAFILAVSGGNAHG